MKKVGKVGEMEQLAVTSKEIKIKCKINEHTSHPWIEPLQLNHPDCLISHQGPPDEQVPQLV